MRLTSGVRLGSYEITGVLGVGGMGEVYRARDSRLGRDVAIKVLPERLAQDAAALSLFEREARAVAALSHPNILAIHDFGEADAMVYAAMELLEGETLRQRLKEGPVTARKVLDYATQIAGALAAAHAKGIIHRDLKPENVFLTSDGRVKLLDFGLTAQRALPSEKNDNGSSPTLPHDFEPGSLVGTVGYMSPEQVRGKPADHRSDIFAFGCVLYEMLTGKRAFLRDTPPETMAATLRDDPPPIPGRADVPPGLERIVLHCLEKDPEERFQSARDVAFDLQAALTVSSPSGATIGGSVRGEVAAVARARARTLGLGDSSRASCRRGDARRASTASALPGVAHDCLGDRSAREHVVRQSSAFPGRRPARVRRREGRPEPDLDAIARRPRAASARRDRRRGLPLLVSRRHAAWLLRGREIEEDARCGGAAANRGRGPRAARRHVE